MWRLVILGFLLAFQWAAMAETFTLPSNGDTVIGESYFVIARHSDTLVDIAQRNGVGYDEIKSANPGVDPWLPGEGTRVVIPAQYILPVETHEGMVINLAEKRIYYFPKAKPGELATVVTYPISIGRQNWETPLGETKIVRKKRDPTWTPPQSIREEHAAKGDILPDVVPAGPDNPLGNRAMYLGIRGYLIHGTNKPAGIGMRVSHGCIRMLPANIENLFELVPKGEKVTLIDVPFKFGLLNGEIYLEAQKPANSSIHMHNDLQQLTQLLLKTTKGNYGFNLEWSLVDEQVAKPTGVPIPVGVFSGQAAMPIGEGAGSSDEALEDAYGGSYGSGTGRY
jgi:L,D-transpeptidase ErfK/SrfK